MASPPPATWTIEAPDQATVSALSDAHDCSPVLATALASRGYTDPETAKRSLDPTPRAIEPPTQLPDVDAAVDRIDGALEAGERVTVFADRDVDGVMGGTARRLR